MPTFNEGLSYFSAKRNGWVRDDYSVWTLPAKLLPVRVAPLDKQIRVAVNDTEYAYNPQTNQLGQPTSNYFTIDLPTATNGVPCWGVKFVINGFGGNAAEVAELSVWDTSGVIALDATWLSTTSNNRERAIDSDTTTEYVSNTGAGDDEIILHFPKEHHVTKVGWTRPVSGSRIEDIEVFVNTGSLTTPIWTSIGALTGILDSQYPALSMPYDPETMTLQMEVPASLQTARTTPDLTLVPAPTEDEDRVIIWRETRQDQPWVQLAPGGRGHSFDVYWYFKQILFILQELCELQEVGGMFSVGVGSSELNDHTIANQSVLTAGGGTVFSYATIPLLEGITGAPADVTDAHQIIAEVGDQTDGTSTTWAALTLDATPANAGEYSVDTSAKTVTLGAAETSDIRIRRTTKIDDLWVDFRTDQPNWNTGILGLIQKQLKFLAEESCLLPKFYKESPLNTSLFPRAWNWLRYVGTGPNFPLGGPFWGGDGEISVFDNDVELTTPDDYTIEFPNIVIPNATGPVSIGSGGGGGFSSNGPQPSGDADDVAPASGLCRVFGVWVPCPTADASPIDWPGFVDTTQPLSIQISAVPTSHITSGDWEGAAETFSGGVDGHLIRISLTANESTLQFTAGNEEIVYMGMFCSSSLGPFASALARRAVSTDPWDTATSSAATGCLGGPAILSGNNLYATVVLQSNLPPQHLLVANLRKYSGSINTPGLQAVPGMQPWLDLLDKSQLAKAEGVVAESGFTWQQYQDYINPAVDFTDFDIP